MGNETTYSGVLGSLGRLSTALEANAADLVHLEGPRLRIAAIVAEAQALAQQQAALTAGRQETSRQFQILLAESQRLATGMSRFLAAHYGIRSEKLTEFGLQPFRGRKPRTPKTLTSPGLPAPAADPPAPDVNRQQ